jgi:tRNA(adenine34) deaminase
MLFTNNLFMHTALAEAKRAYEHGEVPVGAVVVDTRSNIIIAAAGNLVEADCNPTAHAEMLAIQAACRKEGSSRLPYCDLYVTLEPCPMCAQAISFARIRRLYFGAYDQKGGGVEHGPCIFSQPTCHHRPDVYGGLHEQEAGLLLREFFKELRL